MFLGFGNPGALPQARDERCAFGAKHVPDFTGPASRRVAGSIATTIRFGDCGQSPLPTKSTQAFDTNASTTARVAVLVSSTAAGVSLGNLFQLRAKHIHSPVAVEITGQRDVKPVALFAFNDES